MNLMVRADEEDDFGELSWILDLGMAVAACEADEACKSMMVLLPSYFNNCWVCSMFWRTRCGLQI